MAPELGVLLLKSPLISKRQAAGIFLAFCIIMGGRMVRHFMLVDPNGQWRDNLWLEASVYGGQESGQVKKAAKVKLTSPLPINTCSEDSLTLLPGVGKVLAGRIVEARSSGLVFACPEDLKIVKGIGPAMCRKLAPHVIFQTLVADTMVFLNQPSE